MNCNERADNMSKRKPTDYFKPGNNKKVRKDVNSTVQNEPMIGTTTSQDKDIHIHTSRISHIHIHTRF